MPRTSLFLPAPDTRRAAAAVRSGADEVVVDLEDSVAASHKAIARQAMAQTVSALGQAVPVTVRINSEPELVGADLAACAAIGVASLLLPKVERPADVLKVRDLLAELNYSPALGILIESSQGVVALNSILAESGPLRTAALGNEDLRNEIELGAPSPGPEPAALTWAHGALILAAHSTGVMPLGLTGSIAELENLDALRAGAVAARRMGYLGTYCVHPAQVPPLQAAFGPDENDIAWARDVVAAAEASRAEGRGTFRVSGRMVDAPLIQRAERILRAADRL